MLASGWAYFASLPPAPPARVQRNETRRPAQRGAESGHGVSEPEGLALQSLIARAEAGPGRLILDVLIIRHRAGGLAPAACSGIAGGLLDGTALDRGGCAARGAGSSARFLRLQRRLSSPWYGYFLVAGARPAAERIGQGAGSGDPRSRRRAAGGCLPEKRSSPRT